MARGSGVGRGPHRAMIPVGRKVPRVPVKCPEPVRPLGQHGRELWDRVWGAGATWLSVEVDLELVQLLAETSDERARVRAVVFGDDGNWRARSQLRAVDAHLAALLVSLGFTPVERARMALGGAEPEATGKLAQLRAVADGIGGK